MAEFRMPSLGADMEEGTLLEWRVQPGTRVHKGDIVAVVDTAKAAVEVECFASGVVGELLVRPGQRVPVGTVLATIVEPAAAATPAPKATATPAPTATATPALTAPARSAAVSPVTSPLVRRLAAARHVDLHDVSGTGLGGRITHADIERAATARPAPAEQRPAPAERKPARPERLRVSPFARRLAAELGVDLAAVTGTGADGAIHAIHVRHAARAGAEAAPTTAEAAPATAERARGAGAPAEVADRTDAMRRAVAALMARSKREIPHYYLAETIDLTPALGWMRERNRQVPVPDRLVPAALLLKAAATALRSVPALNGFWADDHFVPGPGIHPGVAVSLRGGGLVAPALHDAADLDLASVMARLRDLVARTRAGRLRRAELAEPTVTVSNLGDEGVESIFGVIYPPQVALVGFGRIVERPWAVDGLLGVREVVTVSLAADHRATDGATGARYLRTVAHLLGKPEEL